MAERRDLLRKAALAGTGAFALPMIVTVGPADAQALTSPPPESPERPSRPGTAGSSRPGAPALLPRRRRANPVAAQRADGRTELPRTGANLDRLTAAGLAATAGGAALVLWSADRRATTSTSTAGATTIGARSSTDTGSSHTGTMGTGPGT